MPGLNIHFCGVEIADIKAGVMPSIGIPLIENHGHVLMCGGDKIKPNSKTRMCVREHNNNFRPWLGLALPDEARIKFDRPDGEEMAHEKGLVAGSLCHEAPNSRLEY